MGHHIFQTYLGAADQKFWSEAVEGNYGPLDVEEALKLWPEGEWLLDIPQLLIDKNPTLAIQLSLLGRFPGAGKILPTMRVASTVARVAQRFMLKGLP